MPFVDMSDVILDPTISGTSFTVTRRAVTLVKGRNVITPTDFNGVLGSINAASPNDLQRLPDYEVGQKVISIVTKFRLQMQSPGFLPDLITYRGDQFIVNLVDDYSAMGPGFIEALATSIVYNDPPPQANGGP